MKTFTTLNVASRIKNPTTTEIVEILKVRKDGTKRIFFKPTYKGQTIGSTMFARLYDAENLAKRYLNR